MAGIPIVEMTLLKQDAATVDLNSIQQEVVMKKYDSRMGPLSNLKWTYFLPLVCKLRGHNYHCFRIVPTDPQKWFYWCYRCMDMTGDKYEPCGGCDNGCRDY